MRKVKDMCRADGHRDAGQKPRPHGGHWVYWVRWKGFPSSDNTWEPAECFSDSKLWRRFNDKLERLKRSFWESLSTPTSAASQNISKLTR